LAADGFIDLNEYWYSLLERYQLDEPNAYKIGYPHNNCQGFCVKGGLAHYKLLWEKEPEQYLKFEEEEQQFLTNQLSWKENRKGHSGLLRKSINGVKTYITLKQYRTEYLEPNNIDLGEEAPDSCNACMLDNLDAD
jgi:hypothetical protein